MTLIAEIGLAVRGAIGGDVFAPATLHVATDTTNDDGETVKAFADHVTTGFISNWAANVAAARGYSSDTAKIVLVQGSYPKPQPGDEVTGTRPLRLETERYRVIEVSSDPADATWAVAGVLI
jgi:hypothetical protein